jgi:ATP-dependent Clp protease adapter protein ClpS
MWSSRRPPGEPSVRGAASETRPTVAEETGTDVTVEPPWMTILWNCDCHTFEQVARQLMRAIACSYDEGMAIAGRVHNDGKAVVRVGARSECERVGKVLAEIGLRVTVAES